VDGEGLSREEGFLDLEATGLDDPAVRAAYFDVPQAA